MEGVRVNANMDVTAMLVILVVMTMQVWQLVRHATKR